MAPVRMSVSEVHRESPSCTGRRIEQGNSASSEAVPACNIDEIADHLDPRELQRMQHAAQHIEMSDGGRSRHQVYARLDDHRSSPLASSAVSTASKISRS